MADGKGERLLPYTTVVPKPLIPIGERPIAELVVDSFYQYGCRQFFFSLNYKKNMIKAYFDELERDYEVRYIEEDEPLGSGGSLWYAKGVLDETFFLSNCDILLEIDYANLLKFHKKSGNLITVVTSMKRYVIPYGTVTLSPEGKIDQLVEKPALDYLVNTGVYVMEPRALEYIREKHHLPMTDLIEECLRAGESIGTYPISDDAWMDMGQFGDMEKMKKRFER